MIILTGYEILTQIYESFNSEVYKGIRSLDKQPVIIKVLNKEFPSAQELTRYRQEYNTICSLKFEGALKAYGLETYNRTLVLIVEDFGGISLKKRIEEKPLSLKEFLVLAIQIVEYLGNIHAAKIIHKDLNPANIIFNQTTGQLKIVDFGIATVLERENPSLKSLNVLEGTLAYISPEQTGRMNRSLDYRTDFYSLGVTFYELLTGRLPFETNDAMELIHYHLAKQPQSPAEINPDLPLFLSNLVMKLMAKTAEERYQSAYGIKADLEECLRQLETQGKIETFALATQDLINKFQIPQKLYGREEEIAALLAAFERIATKKQANSYQTELMIV